MNNNKKRSKTQTRVSKQGVAPVALQVTVNSKGEKKKKARNLLSVGGSDGERYKTALMNPFSDAALGVRVPDQFFAPTATLALREIVTMSNNAQGLAEVILLPSVIQPAVSFKGSIANGSTMYLPDGQVYLNAMISNSPAALQSKITNHRIVSWGVRIRNTSALTATAGVLTVAALPTRDRTRVPSNLQVGPQGPLANIVSANAENFLSGIGIPFSGSGTTASVDTTSLLDLPFHARYQGVQLAEQTFEVHPKMCSPSALHFRNSANSTWGMDSAYYSATGSTTGDGSYVLADGWTPIVVAFSGGSTVAGSQTFDIEIIYHIEGSPNVQTGTIFVADTPVSVHNPVAVLLAQAALNSAPTFTKVAGAAMAAYRAFSGQ